MFTVPFAHMCAQETCMWTDMQYGIHTQTHTCNCPSVCMFLEVKKFLSVFLTDCRGPLSERERGEEGDTVGEGQYTNAAFERLAAFVEKNLTANGGFERLRQSNQTLIVVAWIPFQWENVCCCA